MSEYDANKYLAESVGKRDPKPRPQVRTFPLARFAAVLLGVAVLCICKQLFWPL